MTGSSAPSRQQELLALPSPRPFQSRVEKTYISEIEMRAASGKALFFLQSLPWLAECTFHGFLAPMGESTMPEAVEPKGGRPMKDWMAFATAVVVALLTRMLLA